jgi:peptide/nickel transport system substrate-binding protein
MNPNSYWMRAESSVSRRRFIGAGALAATGVAGLTFVGCGDDDDGGNGASPTPSGGQTPGASPTPSEQPRPGGTFRSTGASPIGIQDPHFGATNQWVTPYFADPLLKIGNESRELEPGLVERWEQADDLTVILHLRQGVKFFNLPPANGREMEAKDVVYAIKSMTGAQYPDAAIPFPRRTLFDGMRDAVAVDQRTVRLEFTRPRSDFIIGLAEKRTAVIPEGLREHFGAIDSLHGPRVDRLIGTGPYICEKFDGQSEMIWKKNPDYWDKPYPYIDTIQANVVADANTWATALISGQNYMLLSVQEQTLDLVRRGLSDVQVVKYPPDGFWYHIGLNTRIKPLDDPRVRKAIGLVFDKPAFSQTIFGRDDRRYPGPLPWIYGEALTQEQLAALPGMRSPTSEDIAEARQLVDLAGYGGGFTITITAAVEQLATHQYRSVSEHLKNQVERNIPNARVNIDASNYTAMLAKIGAQNSDFNAYTGGWGHELSPIAMMALSYHSRGGRNFTGYASDRMDGLIDQARSEFDEGRRSSLLKDAQKVALEDWSHIPTHHGQFTALLHPVVRGLDVGSVSSPAYYLRYAWLNQA